MPDRRYGMDDGDGTALPATAEDSTALSQPATQQALDDIMNDPILSMEERVARVEETRRQLSADGDDDGSADYVPLQVQVAKAFSMVADGGHDYSGGVNDEGADGPSGDVE